MKPSEGLTKTSDDREFHNYSLNLKTESVYASNHINQVEKTKATSGMSA
jgi:hypothetical protein